MIKRIIDVTLSLLLLLALSPLLVLIALAIAPESGGSVFYIQQRVGKDNRDFGMIKFRTMKKDAHRSGLLTVGPHDARITRSGRFLRKYKLDELPQLLNVLQGTMSLVGPRPEVRKYVNLYTPEQLRVLTVKPGITDFASVDFSDENERLAASPDPEMEYIHRILPQKLALSLRYLDEQSTATDMKIIFLTLRKIFFSR